MRRRADCRFLTAIVFLPSAAKTFRVTRLIGDSGSRSSSTWAASKEIWTWYQPAGQMSTCQVGADELRCLTCAEIHCRIWQEVRRTTGD
uniref:Secreted protein n=1 Tax=Physcomitrium patens TaxID=3218 RepID=A0A2K1K4I5_PHYPA|nr:hypothetical protein PHYPA_013163 [Physcomitrium patens]